MVLALLVAAFVAGWVARDVPLSRRREEPSPDGGPVEEAGTWLSRCVAAGVDEDELMAALSELDRIDPELERAVGADSPTYRAFDAALNQAHFLRRALAAGEGRPLPATLSAADALAVAARVYQRRTEPEAGRMSHRGSS